MSDLPDDLFEDLDRSGRIPLYHQIAERLQSAILAGDLPPGAKLENEIDLGNRLGISRPTVRKAIEELVNKGLVVRRRGIGTQVVRGQIHRDVELSSLYEDLQKTGQHPETEVLSADVLPASDEIAESLGVEPGSATLHISRLRKSDGAAIAVMNNVLPEELADLDTNALSRRGLYQVLRDRGVNVRVAKQRISARQANAVESNLLGLPKHAPVLAMSRIAYDASGHAVEFGNHCYRPDTYSFEITLVEK